MATITTEHSATGIASDAGWNQIAGQGVDSLPADAAYTMEALLQNRGTAADLLIAFMPSTSAPSADADAGVLTIPASEFASDGLWRLKESVKAAGTIWIKCASSVGWRSMAITAPYTGA